LKAQTGRVIADLAGCLSVRLSQIQRLALDGDDLPAATEPDLFRTDRDARDPAAVQPAMTLLPLSLFLRGKKPAEPAGVGLCPTPRFDCLSSQRGSRRPTPE
jgi:hypothetical protein